MPTTSPDIVLKLVVLDSQGNFFGDKVDVQFKHRTLNLSGGQKGLDASQEIAISGLRRAPQGDYQVTVTPSASFHPQSQFVTVPASGFARAKFVFQKGSPATSQPSQPATQPTGPSQPQDAAMPTQPAPAGSDNPSAPTGRTDDGEDQDVLLKIRVLNLQGDFLGGTVDLEFKPNDGFGETRRQPNVPASQEIDVKGLQQFPSQVYVVTVIVTGTDQLQSQFAMIQPGNVVILEYTFGDGNGDGNGNQPRNGTVVIEVLDSSSNFLGGLVDVSVKNVATAEVSERKDADASSGIVVGGLRPQPEGDYQVTAKPRSVQAQTKTVSLPETSEPSATVSFVFSTPPPPPPSTDAGSSGVGRRVLKATHVPLKLDAPPSDGGRAILKFGYLGQLRLQSGEVSAVRANMPEMNDELANALQSFEGSPIASKLPSPTLFTTVSTDTLLTFGKKITDIRQAALDLHNTPTARAGHLLAPSAAAPTPSAAFALTSLNSAIAAINWFEASVAVTPIGMLNLERLEMTPAGIQRGELLATIPLAPLEKTAVVHKEWSVTTKEFQSIVTDSLENYSETGVTDNTELAQATTSQTAHSNQFNVNGTVTASYGTIVSGSVQSGFTAQDQNSTSATESRKHAITTTRKASSRVKQEHKVTISTTTVTGTSETSTRILENPSATDPIRIDYFSMMRKWHVGLYRYGLRLTYDLAIPEPGAAMRAAYADLENLRSQIGPFAFVVPHFRPSYVRSKSDPHYEEILKLADQYNAQIPPFPEADGPIIVSFMLKNDTTNNEIKDETLPAIDVPQGFWIEHLFISIRLRNVGAAIRVLFSAYPEKTCDRPEGNNFGPDDLTLFSFGGAATGKVEVQVSHHDCQNSGVKLQADFSPTDQNIDAWLGAVWSALYDAAQTQYYAAQQDIVAQISRIEDQLNGVDTLTLRREENEEIMKGVLRWILGPSFDFMPPDVLELFKSQDSDFQLKHGTAPGGGLSATMNGWRPMFLYEEMVKFINEAIEWENVLYFLYSYFWDVQPSWDFIRQLRHPDPTRQAFLRSGSARVVLTVRKGWEEAWVTFVEAGGFGASLIPGHPYLSIATGIALYDHTNYPGIPPANPGGGPIPDDGAYAATECQTSLSPSGSPVVIEVKSSEGFRIGYTAIIDTWDSKVQEIQTITDVSPDGTHITVKSLVNAHSPSPEPFPIMQGGEKGQLIAEWFEYTPTSGTDIAVTSNLATIS